MGMAAGQPDFEGSRKLCRVVGGTRASVILLSRLVAIIFLFRQIWFRPRG
jgi:hypothetical protein